MRGSITRRGKSSWRLKFDVASEGGKRSTRYVTVRATSRQEASKVLTQLLAERDKGTLPEPSRMTIAA
jgi:hypothetical protein